MLRLAVMLASVSISASVALTRATGPERLPVSCLHRHAFMSHALTIGTWTFRRQT